MHTRGAQSLIFWACSRNAMNRRRTFNAVVTGSRPARLTIIFNKLERKSTKDQSDFASDFASFLSGRANSGPIFGSRLI